MTPLKYETVVYFEMDAFDLEQFINEHYGFSDNRNGYSFQSDEEIGNGEERAYLGILADEFSDWDKDKLEEFKKTGGSDHTTRIILTDLCNTGLIPEGNYLIKLFY